MPADFYDLLEVDPDASGEEIRRAYREKARRYHPDVNDHPRARGQFATLNTARQVLMDSTERSRYDRLGHDDYVTQHLDGLPTMSRPDTRGDGAADGVPSDDGTTSDESVSGESVSEERTASDATTGEPDDRAGGSRRTSTTATGSSSRDAATGTAGTTGTGAGKRSRNGASFGRNSGKTTARTGSGRSRRTATRSGRATADRRRAALRRGWIAVALAALVYLGGVAGFASTTPGGLGALTTAVVNDPIGALTTGSPLPAPATAAVDALAAAGAGVLGPDVLFAVGLIALPLAVGVTVGRFGQGVAILYAVAAAVPLAWVAVRPFFPTPLGADLFALALVPLGAALWFLVDVGRYVRG